MNDTSKDQRVAAKESQTLSLRLAIVMFAILTLSYVINSMDRQVFPVMLPAVSDDLAIGVASAGLLSTIFTVGIAAIGIPAGSLADRYSRKSLIMVGIVIYSLFTILTALMPEFWSMLGVRALTGIGEGMQQTALFAAAGAYFYMNRALAIGVLNFAFGAGGFLGPFIGGRILETTGSWQIPLYLYGVAGLIMVGVIALTVSKRFTEKVVPDRSNAENLDAQMPDTFFNRNMILSIILAIVTGLAMFGYIGLYPTYLQSELDFSASAAGLAASMFGLGAMMGIPAGYLGDRFSLRWVNITGFAGVTITGWLLFFVALNPSEHYVLSFLFGTFASGFLFVNVYSLIQRSVKRTMVGRASGVYITCLFGAAAISGYLFGELVTHLGWGAATAIQLVLLPIVGIFVLLFVDTTKLLSTGRPEHSSA